jgi:Ca-activated chloride channel family protein
MKGFDIGSIRAVSGYEEQVMNICRMLSLVLLLSLTLGVGPNRPVLDDNAVVAVDVAVTDRNGNPVTGLKKENFMIFEDGVAQSVIRVSENHKALAVVVAVELNESFPYYLSTAEEFVKALGGEEWGAVVSFDRDPEIVVDFTHDKFSIVAGLRRLTPSYYGDFALFDVLSLMLDRMKNLEQKSAIVLLGTGRDTVSVRHTYGQALRRAQTSDTMIYTVGMDQPVVQDWLPYPDRVGEFRIREAQNTLASFAEASGGLSFQPQFPGQDAAISQMVLRDLRNQYTLRFVSSRADAGGKLRKLRVEVIGTDVEYDRKPDKLKVRHKTGY